MLHFRRVLYLITLVDDFVLDLGLAVGTVASSSSGLESE